MRYAARVGFIAVLFGILASIPAIHRVIAGCGGGGCGPSRSVLYLKTEGDGYGVGGVLPLSSTEAPTIDIEAYNYKGTVDFTLYKASMDQLMAYIVHDDKNQQVTKTVDVSGYETVKTFQTQLAPGNDGRTSVNLPLGSDETGIWFLRGMASGQSTDAYIIRSNFGVIAKEHDKGLLFWAQDFASKRKLSGALLRIYSLRNAKKEMLSGTFGQDGSIILPLPADADVATIERDGQFALLPLNLRYLNESYSSQSFVPKTDHYKIHLITDRPIYKPGDTVQYKATIRTDDDARYHIPTGMASIRVLKDWDDKNPVYQTKQAVSDVGTINGSFVIPADKGNGFYDLKVVFENEIGDLWGQKSDTSINFRVETYRKPEQSISLSVPDRVYIAGDPLPFTVTGSYFSGQPLSGGFEYSLQSAKYYEYEFAGDRKAQSTLMYQYGSWYGDRLFSGNGMFGPGGDATVEEKLPPINDGESKIVTVDAEYDDGTGNPSYAAKNILCYAAEYSAYREDSWESGIVGKSMDLPVVLVANRPDTDLSGRKLSVAVVRKYWIKVQNPDQKYPNFKEQSEDIEKKDLTTDRNGRAIMTLTPKNEGTFEYTITSTDEKGNMMKRIFTKWVSTHDYSSSSSGPVALTVTTDKRKYEPGETATLTIVSSVSDRDILLTMERRRVHRYQIIHMTGTSATATVALDETDMPNMSAEVSSFSSNDLDQTSQTLTISAERRHLTVDVKTDRSTYGPGDMVELTVSAKDEKGAGVSSDVAVWAIDKALFSLTDDNRTDIFKTFWEERYANTQTSHSLQPIAVHMAEGGGCFVGDTMISMADGSKKRIDSVKKGDWITTRASEYDPKLVTRQVYSTKKQSDIGVVRINDSMSLTPDHILWVNGRWMMAGNVQTGDILTDDTDNSVLVSSVEWISGTVDVYNLEIAGAHTFFANGMYVHNEKGGGEGRTVFKDTAYWNPSVKTNAQGTATLRFKLPDDLTTWVVSAVSATDDTSVGETKKDIMVTKSVVVRPILPNLFRIGDTASAGMVIQNFTDKKETFQVSLTAEHMDVASGLTSVTLDAGKSQTVSWKVTPKDAADDAKLVFSAKGPSDAISDKVTKTISVVPFSFTEHSGMVGDGPGSYPVDVASDADPKNSMVTVSLSPTIVGSIMSAMHAMYYYPFDCAEQTTSRILTALLIKANPSLFSDVMSGAEIDKTIRLGFNRLKTMQNPDGGWSWWFEGPSDQFVTAYITEIVWYAKASGVKLDDGMLNQLDGYVRNYAQKVDGTDDHHALATIMAVNMQQPSVNLSVRFEMLSPDILPLMVLSNLKKGIRDTSTNGMNILVSKATADTSSAQWPTGNVRRFGAPEVTTALAIRAMAMGGADRSLGIKATRYLLKSRQSDMWVHTFATAQAMWALTEFYKTGEESTPNYSYTVRASDRVAATGTVTSAKQRIADIRIPVSAFSAKDASVSVVKTGVGSLYTVMSVTQYRTDRNAAPQSRGITLTRTIENAKGPGYLLGVGDTALITLKLSPVNSEQYYGLIEDTLPAGMIPVNMSLKNEQFLRPVSGEEIGTRIYNTEVSPKGMVISIPTVVKEGMTVTYKARVVTEGEYDAPPASFSLMYDPSISARTVTTHVTIGREGTSEHVSPISTMKNGLKSISWMMIGLGIGIAALALVAVSLTVRLFRIQKKHARYVQDPPSQKS